MCLSILTINTGNEHKCTALAGNSCAICISHKMCDPQRFADWLIQKLFHWLPLVKGVGRNTSPHILWVEWEKGAFFSGSLVCAKCVALALTTFIPFPPLRSATEFNPIHNSAMHKFTRLLKECFYFKMMGGGNNFFSTSELAAAKVYKYKYCTKLLPSRHYWQTCLSA